MHFSVKIKCAGIKVAIFCAQKNDSISLAIVMKKIDEIIYDLYGLTEEEIRAVEKIR